jgi:hypothetical protein
MLLRFQRIQNISGLSKDEHRPLVIQCLMMPTGNVENTCCAVHSLVDISSAVWAARRRRGHSRRGQVKGWSYRMFRERATESVY